MNNEREDSECSSARNNLQIQRTSQSMNFLTIPSLLNQHEQWEIISLFHNACSFKEYEWSKNHWLWRAWICKKILSYRRVWSIHLWEQNPSRLSEAWIIWFNQPAHWADIKSIVSKLNEAFQDTIIKTNTEIEYVRIFELLLSFVWIIPCYYYEHNWI